MVRFYEDLTVGDTYKFGYHKITQEEIVEFARQFDPQPFHVDSEAAENSIFGGLIASGLHTLCLATCMTVENYFDEVENLGGSGMDELRWTKPVRPGDELSTQIEVLEKRPSESKPDRGYVDHRRSMVNQDSEEVMSVIIHNIVQRRDVQ